LFFNLTLRVGTESVNTFCSKYGYYSIKYNANFTALLIAAVIAWIMIVLYLVKTL